MIKISVMNFENLDSILETLNEDVLPEYISILMEDTNKLYDQFITMGMSPTEAHRSSLVGAINLSLLHATRLNLIINCMGNSTDNLDQLLDAMKNNIKFDSESMPKNIFSVIPGGKIDT